ncbi:MAG: hypothetical protein IKK96_07545, partial [Lachnospiraceae bacterium]|nr:hypothetical protein [Lachnospiraceae bacterium]
MRKIKILFVMGVLACMFVGCQKEGVQQINSSELPNTESEQRHDSDNFEWQGDDEKGEDVQPTESPIENRKHFEAAEGWKDLSGYEYAVQVEDVLYIPGITTEEIIDKVESSSIEYTYEYNGNRLVSKNEEVEISVYRDGKAWFSIIARNFEGETKSLSG